MNISLKKKKKEDNVAIKNITLSLVYKKKFFFHSHINTVKFMWNLNYLLTLRIRVFNASFIEDFEIEHFPKYSGRFF